MNVGDWGHDVRVTSISSVREGGSTRNKAPLEAFLKLEEATGYRLPFIVFSRLASEWVSDQTPTILRKWKNSVPAP